MVVTSSSRFAATRQSDSQSLKAKANDFFRLSPHRPVSFSCSPALLFHCSRAKRSAARVYSQGRRDRPMRREKNLKILSNPLQKIIFSTPVTARPIGEDGSPSSKSSFLLCHRGFTRFPKSAGAKRTHTWCSAEHPLSTQSAEHRPLTIFRLLLLSALRASAAACLQSEMQ